MYSFHHLHDFFNHYIVADPACSEGEVRLFNNQSSDGVVMGQVEFCTSTAGFRSKVCDTNWDDRDAEVVCRELGLLYGEGTRLKLIYIIVQWSNDDCVFVFCSKCSSSKEVCVWRRKSNRIL